MFGWYSLRCSEGMVFRCLVGTVSMWVFRWYLLGSPVMICCGGLGVGVWVVLTGRSGDDVSRDGWCMGVWVLGRYLLGGPVMMCRGMDGVWVCGYLGGTYWAVR